MRDVVRWVGWWGMLYGGSVGGLVEDVGRLWSVGGGCWSVVVGWWVVNRLWSVGGGCCTVDR